MSNRQQRRAERRAQSRPHSNQQPPTPVIASGGPNTPEGKAVSSRNSLRHGLTAARLVLPWESQADFDNLFTQLLAEHDPQTVTETMFLREMAEQWWRLQRARNEEYRLHVRMIEDPDPTDAELVAYDAARTLARRYATGFERGFHKNFNLLRKLQKERRAKEAESRAPDAEPKPAQPVPQFVSQKTDHAVAAPGSQPRQQPAPAFNPPLRADIADFIAVSDAFFANGNMPLPYESALDDED